MGTLELNKLVQEWRELCAMADEIEKELDEIENTIKAEMITRGVEEMAGKDWKATYRSVTSRRVDTTALKKAAPDVAELYTVEKTSRRFCIA